MTDGDSSNELAYGLAETVNTRPGPGETRDCLDPWFKPFVQPNGDVWPCCWFYDRLGNVNEEPFDKIMNGTAFQELRRELLTGRLGKACVECPSRGTTTPDQLLTRLHWRKRFPER
jgi:radical SAM protein with 4Fe4S-binding SPASM domain